MLRLIFVSLWALSLIGGAVAVVMFWSCLLPQYIKELQLGRKLTKNENPTPNAEKYCYFLVAVCVPMIFIFRHICLTYFN